MLEDITGEKVSDPHINLFDCNILDSFGTLILISQLESEFLVKIELQDSGIDAISSIALIESTILNSQESTEKLK